MLCGQDAGRPDETRMSTINANRPTRLAASLFTKYLVDLVGFAVNRYKISIEELAIIALVFTESTRALREDPDLARNFGFEREGLPNKYRPTVSLKDVYTTLGLSRETTRRKLERLVERGFLVRLDNRYLFALPPSGEEFSSDFRLVLMDRLGMIVSEADILRAPVKI